MNDYIMFDCFNDALLSMVNASVQYWVMHCSCIYHAQQCIIKTIKHNIIIHLIIKDAMTNKYQISYIIFIKCIFVSYIKFSIKVWLLTLNVTAATIIDLLCITINYMILHVCSALLFHKMHQRNIGQTFHVLLKWPLQVCFCWNAPYCFRMRWHITQCELISLLSLGASQTTSTM